MELVVKLNWLQAISLWSRKRGGDWFASLKPAGQPALGREGLSPFVSRFLGYLLPLPPPLFFFIMACACMCVCVHVQGCLHHTCSCQRAPFQNSCCPSLLDPCMKLEWRVDQLMLQTRLPMIHLISPRAHILCSCCLDRGTNHEWQLLNCFVQTDMVTYTNGTVVRVLKYLKLANTGNLDILHN